MVEKSVATGSLRPVSTSGNGSAESSLYVVLRTWMRKWVYLRFFLKVVMESCGLCQICDEVCHTDVGKADMRPKHIRECALEALRLRRRRVKRLKASKSNFYVKVMATRQRYALARLQLVLDLSMWNMLNNGVCVLDFDNEDCHDGMDDSLYVEGECMVCSNIPAYLQVQLVGNREFEVDDESSDEAESVLSVSQGCCCGN